MAMMASPACAQADLPLPRFVSLRSAEVNLRAGPGIRFPIEWVFVRRGMPVEVIAHDDTWRKIRDHQGVEGWVHQQGLTGRRTALVAGTIRTLHRRADRASPVIATLDPGVLLSLQECKKGWCRAEVEGRRGWIVATEVWGVYPGEEFE